MEISKQNAADLWSVSDYSITLQVWFSGLEGFDYA